MNPRILKFKTFLGLLAVGSFLIAGAPGLSAHPLDNVTPDDALYQRVQKLGDAGLLDPGDQALLDQGRIVTRLELALFVEKSESRLGIGPETGSNPSPLVVAQAPPAPEPVLSTPASANTPSASPLSPSVGPALQKEIRELLKILEEESSYLRTRLSLDDVRVHQQEKELEKLQAAQAEVDATFRKADESTGSPHFTSISNLRVENLDLSGITAVSASRIQEEVNLGAWSDLGGKGSISVGLGGYLFGSNASSSPVSIYQFSPVVNYNLDGKLGHWSATVAVEDYTYDTDLGVFTRGQAPGILRFEDPFDIKKYSADKDLKNWDDYMTNLGYVPSAVAWQSQNSSTKVFDGLYMIGSQLPLVSPDARATILLGRMGSSVEPNEWEEALKYSQPWLGGALMTSFSTLWVNDNDGIVPAETAAIDMKDYAANIGIDLHPVFIGLDAAFSDFYTGMDSQNPLDPQVLSAPAGQASLSLYPLTFYYTAISDGYANMQSKVVLAGINSPRFGLPNIVGTTQASGVGASNAGVFDNPGYVGMVDDLVSNRYGWRANLGWKGRQESWSKDLPAFLDDILVNFDVAQKTEYSVLPDEVGHNVVQVNDILTVYYPEDTGLWGNSLWGGYNGLQSVGTEYVNHLTAQRNDGISDEVYMMVGNGTTQRVPFMLPVYSSPGVLATSGGENLYTLLDHLKTYHYLTLTTKIQFNKWFNLSSPFYGSFFFTDNGVSGNTANPVLSAMPDPNRPGQTLGSFPSLFDQTVYDGSLMVQVVRNVQVMGDYGLELWKSDYTYPLVDQRTDSVGLGLAYDLPWGGGKLEARYKHLVFQDTYVPANNYQADQVYTYFLFGF